MKFQFSKATEYLRSSEIRDLMSVAIRPDVISFAGGMPGNELFPVKDVEELMRAMPEKTKQDAFQYGPTPGYPPLLESLSGWLKQKGFPMDTNKLMITTGSLQAINILGKVFINPGDVVLTEKPSFIGAISAFQSYQANIVSIPIDSEGIIISELKKALQLNPKFLYLCPNFHNPAGIMYSVKRRREVLEAMKDANIPIIEDDAYADLYFDPADEITVKPLKILSSQEEQICYTGSFSKIFGPGMRLGWMLVAPEVYTKCEITKQAIDACSPNFTQALANEFITSGKIFDYIKSLRVIYKTRRDCMISAMKKYFPAEASWVKPQGGFYIWVKLPEGLKATDILKETIQQGAIFVIGKTFDPAGKDDTYFRLSFSNTPEAQIEKGIRIIGDVLKQKN